jgi:two-component system, cell cycle sensor histidine kinase and response regulator CckA
VARRILQKAGFSVREAINGAEALAMLQEQPGDFDVVLSDILMPEMDGIELAVRARAEGADIRVVLMTGFAEFARDRERSEGLCEAILGKPFEPEELVATLREAVARPS